MDSFAELNGCAQWRKSPCGLHQFYTINFWQAMSNHATVVVTTATRLQHTHTTYIYCTTPKYRLSQIIPVTSWIDSTHIWMMSTVSVATILTMCSGMLVLSAHGTSVTISNAHPRVNVTGDIMDAHDGSYNQWTSGGEWYYYAMVRACVRVCVSNGVSCADPNVSVSLSVSVCLCVCVPVRANGP